MNVWQCRQKMNTIGIIKVDFMVEQLCNFAVYVLIWIFMIYTY